MHLAFTSAMISSAAIFMITVIYVLAKVGSSKRRKTRLCKQIPELGLNSQRSDYIFDTTARANVLYNSYILHSALCLLCRLFSGIFTVCGFFMTNTAGYDNLQQILSILSVFFVLLTVYLIPQDRSKQYLLAWRRLDGHVLTLYTTDYSSMSEAEIADLFEKSVQFRTDIENSLVNDEDK